MDYKTLYYPVFLLLICLCSCSSNQKRQKHSFGDYTIPELIELKSKIRTTSYFDGTYEYEQFIDSLREKTPKADADMHYFLDLIHIYERKNVGNEHIYDDIGSLVDLTLEPDFKNQHRLNRSLLHYFTAKLFEEVGNTEEMVAHLERSVNEIENQSEEYYALLGEMYAQLSGFSINNGEYEKSFEILNKALEIAEQSQDYSQVYKIYKMIAVSQRKQKKYKETLTSLHLAEQAARKVDDEQTNNRIWAEIYDNKISLFYMLDDIEPESKQYVDSIHLYLSKLEQAYTANEISQEIYHKVISHNINSIIKLGEYDRAKEMIATLEPIYLQNRDDNCYKLALLNMSKYVLERTIGTPQSYYQALLNAYEHMETCGDPETQYYSVMKGNVLYFLKNIDSERGNYKDALKWTNLKNEYDKTKNSPDIQYQNRLKQVEFLANREMEQAKHIAELNQQKVKLIRDRLIALSLFLVIFIALTATSFYLYKKTKQQNYEIAKSKHQLVQTNEQLTSLNQDLNQSSKEIEEQKKQLELELKNKLLFIMQRNEMINSLKDEINDTNIEAKEKKRLLNLIEYAEDENVWEDIENQYFEANKEFIKELTNRHPGLTAQNTKLCILLRMGLSTKEIASLTYSTPQSVKMARSRLNKKLGIDTSQTNAYSYLNSIEKSEVV